MPSSNRSSPRRWLRPVLGFVFVLASGAASADPSVPWTPSLAARHSLELLVDDGGLELPLTQWPLPRAAVSHALDRLPRELPPALDVARARVVDELRAAAGGQLSATLRNREEAATGFGDDGTPGSWVGVRSPTLASGTVALQLGARADDSSGVSGDHAKARLDDSALGIDLLGGQLMAWAHHNWWGPGWQSSLLLGNNAAPLTGVGLQRAEAVRSESPWLSWLGPWSYDFFVAQNEDAMDSYFVGTRVTMKPFRLVEIGLSRTAQWGGRGRPQSFGSFMKMLVGLGVNADSTSAIAEDPANEMSGIDLRVRCGFGLRCAAYTQLIGEDATHHVPSRYLGLYGLETWSADGRYRWYGEYVEALCGAVLGHNTMHDCAYRNHAYPEGYVTDSRWIGSAFGSDSRVLTLGWMDAERGTSLKLHTGSIGSRLGVAVGGGPAYAGSMHGLSARQSWAWGRVTMGAELDWTTVKADAGRQNDGRVGLSMRLPF